MKTVLYVHHVSGMGGASHCLLLLARHMEAQGFRPVVVGQQVHEGVCEACEREGITYYPLYLSSWAKSDQTWRDLIHIPNKLNTLRRLVRICRKEDVSLIHTNLSFCMDGALAASVLRLPHVFHVRDEFSPYYRIYYGGTRGAVRTMNRFSDAIITVSNGVAQPFRQHNVGDTVHVVPDAVTIPPEPDNYNSDTVRQQYDLPVDARLIGQFGVLAERKGQIDLVRALAHLHKHEPDTHAVIVGSGYDSYADSVRAEAVTLGITDRVHFIPHVKDVWPLTRAMDIITCPSRAEGFGLVFVEGMGAGKPVVGTAVGGITDIIRDGENGLLVPPAAPEKLADALLRFIRDDDFRARCVETGLREATTRYTPELHIARVAEVYRNLLKTRR